ncbi:transposase, partial [Patescibacteria group bacterium]
GKIINNVGVGSSNPKPIGSSNPKMKMNDTGKMINDWYIKLPKRFPNISLDEYIIMPNHMHGIIIINNGHKLYGRGSSRPTNGRDVRIGRDDRAPTLGQIVAYFKYQSAKHINDYFVQAGIIPPNTIRKIWQRNFYEHIIRSDNDLLKIRVYIINNPGMWDRDRNNPDRKKQKINKFNNYEENN